MATSTIPDRSPQAGRAAVSGGVEDAEHLRELIARLAGVDDVGLSGPFWDLSTTARRKAREKALEAAGSGDHGTAVSGTAIATMAQSLPAARESLPARTLELKVAPGGIEVHASVAVTFEFRAD